MEEQRSKEYSSLDLTEDEDSSEANPEINNSPFHFVDCSKSLNEEPVPPQTTGDSVTISPSKYFNFNDTSKPNVPQSPKAKAKSTSIKADLGKKVTQFTSVQIKPPRSSGPDTQDIPEGDILTSIGTISCSSKQGEANAVNRLPSPPPLQRNPQLLNKSFEAATPRDNATTSPKQPPGKVVVIKKNNKFYKIIIPHNVMPNINQSIGPVLINIPEVGPLVISNDPKAAKITPSENVQQLSLNLDAVKPKLNSIPVAKSSADIKRDTLKDKKFCWTFNYGRKRDLDGYTVTDRMGFTKTDATRARKCEKHIMNIIAKYQSRLTILTKEFEKFKISLLKKEKVTLVKINTIIQRGNKTKRDFNDVQPIVHPQNLCNSQQEALPPPETEAITDSIESDEYHSDLLLTKKVVMLDKNNKEVRRKRRTKDISTRKLIRRRRKNLGEASRIVKDGRKKNSRNLNIKPCYVQIVKDKRVEEAYKRFCKDKDLRIKEKPPKTKKKVGLNASISAFRKLNSSSKYFIPNHETVEKTKAGENVTMMLSRIIQSEELLEQAVNIHKPILVMTDQTIYKSLEYYCSEFSKNNIIYVISPSRVFPDSVLKCEGFVSAVEIGYVKLIESGLFYRFAKNGMRVYSPENTRHYAEHNYTFLSHTLKNKMYN